MKFYIDIFIFPLITFFLWIFRRWKCFCCVSETTGWTFTRRKIRIRYFHSNLLVSYTLCSLVCVKLL